MSAHLGRAFAVAVLMLPCASDLGQCAEFKSVATKEGKIIILLSNEITPGDDDVLKSHIKKANDAGKAVSTMRLNSPGGNLLEAVKLAATIKYAQLATAVAANAQCASACFIAFAAGNDKFVNFAAQIGVHGASDEAGRETERASAATVSMARLVKELGVPAAIIGKMVVTPPDEMVWLSPNDLRSMGATMIGKPAQVASPATAERGAVRPNQLPSASTAGEPLALGPTSKPAAAPPSWPVIVQKAIALSADQNGGKAKTGRVCEPELRACSTAIFYTNKNGVEMMIRRLEDADGKVIKRDVCSFNNFGDVRTCFNWDSGETVKAMQDSKGRWMKIE